ncbi:MAG: toll/interleukin-1 receptor domain-containing protein [bacterium]|nr:toll/interleukin-1 receptor domain-containing protein [bacterium]
MAGTHVFVAHASSDDALVQKIREALEPRVKLWVASRELAAGEELDPEIRGAIDDSSHLIALLSLDAPKSDWVEKEVAYARELREQREEGLRIIPVLVTPLEPKGEVVPRRGDRLYSPWHRSRDFRAGDHRAGRRAGSRAAGERPGGGGAGAEPARRPGAGARLAFDRRKGRHSTRHCRGAAGLPAGRRRASSEEPAVRLQSAAGADRGRRPGLVPGALRLLAEPSLPASRQGDRGEAAGVGRSALRRPGPRQDARCDRWLGRRGRWPQQRCSRRRWRRQPAIFGAGGQRFRGLPDELKALIPVLQQILEGSRDPALASTPGLFYTDAAEVTLLLEHLAAGNAD